LQFEQVAEGTLDLTTSKTDTAAVFDVTAYPLFMQAVRAVPATERVGPLVVDDEGVPLRRRHIRISIAMSPTRQEYRVTFGTCLHAMGA